VDYEGTLLIIGFTCRVVLHDRQPGLPAEPAAARGRQWETESWDKRFHVGLGYRGLNDDSTQDPAGYHRQSNYFYLPLGLKMYHDLTDHWQIGLGGEFDLLLLGVQLTQIGDDGTLTNLQWPGWGPAVERAPTRVVDLAIAPFVQSGGRFHRLPRLARAAQPELSVRLEPHLAVLIRRAGSAITGMAIYCGSA
jgi:hypothetical protein